MDDTGRQWLNERQAVYHLLALFYRGKICSGLDVLHDTGLLTQLAEILNHSLLTEGVAMVVGEITAAGDKEQYARVLMDDYRQLFTGPDHLLAPPWESVYLTKEKLLFGEPELAVRNFYHSAGLQVGKSEPADHLALELSFMARLCALAQANPEAILVKQQLFLNHHLLQWVPDWAADVTGNAQTAFWPGLAVITKSWLANDLREVQEAVAVLRDGLEVSG